MLVAKNGTITAAVDHAARKIIKDAGYGEFFTHRLGHGETGRITYHVLTLINRVSRYWARGP